MALSVLSVIGLILKWILLIAAGLIALILLLLMIILLGPVRYEAEGKGTEDLRGRGRISYYGFLLRARAKYRKGELTYDVRFLNKRLSGNARSEASEPSPEETALFSQDAAKSETEPKSAFQAELENAQPEKTGEPDRAASEVKEKPDSETIEAAEEREETAPIRKERSVQGPPRPPEEPASEAEPPAGESLADRLIACLDKLSGAIWDFPDAAEDKLESMMGSYELWREKWESFPQKKEALRAVLKLLRRLLKPVLPKTLSLEAEVGLGDPGNTALLLGYFEAFQAAVLPAPSRKCDVRLQGDLENKKTVFSGKVTGIFCLGWFVPPVLAALCTPAVWRLIRFVKTLNKTPEEAESAQDFK